MIQEHLLLLVIQGNLFSLFRLNDSFVSATEQLPHLFNEESINAMHDGERYHLP